MLGLSCIILYQSLQICSGCSMEPMVVMAARAAQTVGQELLKAHQNRHKLDLQVEEKGIDGPVTRVDRYLVDL